MQVWSGCLSMLQKFGTTPASWICQSLTQEREHMGWMYPVSSTTHLTRIQKCSTSRMQSSTMRAQWAPMTRLLPSKSSSWMGMVPLNICATTTVVVCQSVKISHSTLLSPPRRVDVQNSRPHSQPCYGWPASLLVRLQDIMAVTGMGKVTLLQVYTPILGLRFTYRPIRPVIR